MIGRGQSVVRVVGDAHGTGQVGFPIGPARADPVAPHDHPMLVARPMATYQRDGPAVRRVQRRVIDHQKARSQRNTVRFLRSPGVAIRVPLGQQTRVGSMRRTIGASSRMEPRCCGAEYILCSDQEVDIVQLVTLWRVHRLT